jgi:hypothetical protein
MQGLDARGAGRQRVAPLRDPMRLGNIHDRMVRVNIDRGDLRTFCDATGQSLENIHVMASESIALCLAFNTDDDSCSLERVDINVRTPVQSH